MKILNKMQNTQEWENLRKTLFGASECASMLDIAEAYESRKQLLKRKKTGIKPEISAYTQSIFDAGHEAEAKARVIIEEQYNLTLAPITAILNAESKISASFDGHDVFENVIWEHKLFSNSERSKKRFELAKENKVTDYDMAQIQQQLLVSNAQYCLFTVSDGTEENMITATIMPDINYFAKITAGWTQFEIDLNNKLFLNDESPELIAKMELLQRNRDEIKRLEAENKSIEESAYSLLQEQGADEIKCANATIKCLTRKGTIDYSAIPELKNIDLEQYRGASKNYYAIVFGVTK